MNTEQIMSLAEEYASDSGDSYYYAETAERKAILKAAIEALVQERDALKAEHAFAVRAMTTLQAERDALSALADKWNLECDELREDNKRLAAEVKTLRDAPPTAPAQPAKTLITPGGGAPGDPCGILAAAPAQQPLTDEQILHFVDIYVGWPTPSYPLGNSDWIAFARAIEAAHGIKGASLAALKEVL